jgi:hypothetical protein
VISLFINKKIMAATKKGGSKSGASVKITFGKKKLGKGKKHFGPRSEKPKKYRGQGGRR